MKTVIVPAPGKIEIRQVETPVINAYQALVKTEMVALCNATDSKLIAGKFPGVDFVKTSTGFGTAGATVHDVALMRRVVGPTIGVKAAGGIRDLDSALALIQAGATRLGTSSGIQIVESYKELKKGL